MSIKQKVILARQLLCISETAKNGAIQTTAMRNGMKQSNLSKMIKSFEDEHKMTVFNRIAAGVTFTQAGEKLHPQICHIEKILNDIEHFSAVENKVSGSIHIQVGEGIGSAYISSALSDFYGQYPDVHLSIHCTLDAPRLSDSLDIAIVYDDPKNVPDAVCLYEGHLTFRLFASKLYIANYGNPKTIKELQEKHLICTRADYEVFSPKWKAFLAKSKRVVATTDSSAMLLSLIKDGVGVSLLPTCIAAKEPALTPLSASFEMVHPFWMICDKKTKDLAKVRALINHIKKSTETL